MRHGAGSMPETDGGPFEEASRWTSWRNGNEDGSSSLSMAGVELSLIFPRLFPCSAPEILPIAFSRSLVSKVSIIVPNNYGCAQIVVAIDQAVAALEWTVSTVHTIEWTECAPTIGSFQHGR